MSPRYTVRAPGCTAWSEARSLRQARKDRAQARAAGIPALIIDERTNAVID